MPKIIIPFAFIIIGIAVFVLFVAMPRPVALELVQETGLIENATFIFLFLGAAICLWRFLVIYKARLFWLEFGILFYAMALRELDPHRILEDFNFLNGDFYAAANIHLAYKLFFAISLFCLFGTFLHFFVTNIPFFIDSFKKRQTWAFTAIGFFVTEFIACAHHKLVCFTLKFLFDVRQENLGFLVRAFEESFELIAAFILCLVAIQISLSAFKAPTVRKMGYGYGEAESGEVL